MAALPPRSPDLPGGASDPVIAADEQRLLDLEASNAQAADGPMQPCAMLDPNSPLEPVLKSLVPTASPKRNRRRANPIADHNAGSVVGAESPGL